MYKAWDPRNRSNRQEDATNLADLAKGAKESQKQHQTKTMNPTPRTRTRTTETARQQWNSMPERTKMILTEHIHIAQVNVNRSPDVMIVMQQEYLRNTDLLLLQ